MQRARFLFAHVAVLGCGALLSAGGLAATEGRGPAAELASVERGRARVEWKRVEVPEGPGAERTARTLKSMLVKAAQKADFGDGGRVVLTAKVVQLSWESRGDVIRLSCTIVGRVEGGASAKSRISFGGAPKDRDELEKQVLSMVASGVVTRLAEIPRSRR